MCLEVGLGRGSFYAFRLPSRCVIGMLLHSFLAVCDSFNAFAFILLIYGLFLYLVLSSPWIITVLEASSFVFWLLLYLVLSSSCILTVVILVKQNYYIISFILFLPYKPFCMHYQCICIFNRSLNWWKNERMRYRMGNANANVYKEPHNCFSTDSIH